jgi:hypothetical protein
MELPKHQKQWVADHLGHSMAVHGQFYRLPMDSVETAKITKLMYLIDHCKMSQVKGMDLNQVDDVLEGEIFLGNTEKQDYDEQYETVNDGNDNDDNPIFDAENMGPGDEPENEGADVDKFERLPEMDLSNRLTHIGRRHRHASDEQNEIVAEHPRKSGKQIAAFSREPWPKKQEDLVIRIFQKYLAKQIVPNKEQCLEHIHRFPHCNGNYLRLKEKVNNLITREKRVKSKGK